MKQTGNQRRWTLAAVTAVIVLTVTGCTPRFDSSQSPLKTECERELFYLDDLIESRSRNSDFPAAALAEAVELRKTAAELMLEDDYELALELIDEAIALLRDAR
jgi:hypothetical protein